jgi:hypothetical protein
MLASLGLGSAAGPLWSEAESHSKILEEHPEIRLCLVGRSIVQIRHPGIYVRLEGLTAVKMSIVGFWVVTSCALVGGYQHAPPASV